MNRPVMQYPLLDELRDWGEAKIEYRFPRWKQLPQIELYMDQMVALLEGQFRQFPGDTGSKLITPSMINNYVKQKVIPPTVKKRYSRTHIAYLIMICNLKPVLPIATIQTMIESQLEIHTLGEIYNHFCDEQEAASRYTMELARQEARTLRESAGSQQEMLSNFSLKMATLANAGKILAEKITGLEMSEEAEKEISIQSEQQAVK
ncbi:DUF1836 domain-containing protein [Paenibacillus wulumuqiensis]|uniref:DUF1836 domain-containing protein n=1 Tax=Paenibacillus wulumuqiensis TaxID=1567107 RepID=UPI000619CD63|nr:DUF1836 domain-containing protein [Paenibacillus wulumuqiensis]